MPTAHTDQAIAYFNGGSWTELPCTYLTVDAGTVQLHVYGAETVEALSLAPSLGAV